MLLTSDSLSISTFRRLWKRCWFSRRLRTTSLSAVDTICVTIATRTCLESTTSNLPMTHSDMISQLHDNTLDRNSH